MYRLKRAGVQMLRSHALRSIQGEGQVKAAVVGAGGFPRLPGAGFRKDL